jgi:selenocysteine-specific translation elongation factor
MNIVIAVPVDENFAAFIGKKGSSNSITFYNRRAESDVIVALFPSQEDEKAYALAQALLIGHKIVISTAAVDRRFGEALVAASLLEKPVILTNDSDVNGVLRGSGISNCKIVPREVLFEAIREGSNADAEGKEDDVRVDVDKAFPVRGIGTVALGIVTRGVVKQHGKLYHSSGKQVAVRSLQSQDEDVASAGVGTRVGVSLKDIGDDEISKGDLLTSTAPVKRSRKLVIESKQSPVAKESVAEGSSYRIAMNFSSSDCIVTGVSGNELELELSAPMPVEKGDEVFLIRKAMPRLFASGRVKEASA